MRDGEADAKMRAPMALRSSAPTLREHLRAAPFSLAMSSGFFGFFAHCGFLSVLEDEALLPRRVTGSSAGALVGALWSAGVDTGALEGVLRRLRRADFWDPFPGAGLLRGRLFRRKIESLLPRTTFSGCRAELAVSVFDLLARRTLVLSSGALAPAIQATCAVPLLFHPVLVEGRPMVDGGVADRPGLVGMPRGERVLFHHLTSRSPWRTESSMEIPSRPGMVTLAIDDLPRVGPFRLEQGPRAFEAARKATRLALDRTLGTGGGALDGATGELVRVGASC
jgi:NTE family protein